MQPVEPILVADLFPAERAGLLALLTSLSEREWAVATACAGWSVHDVALHILGGDLGILSARRDGWREPMSDAGDLARWDTLVAFINRRNDAWVRAMRRTSPRVVCDLLRFTGPEIGAYFAGRDPFAVGGPVHWAGPDAAPVWLDTAREYSERWVHQQHIRDAVSRPGMTERRLFAPVLDAFVRALPHALRDLHAPDATRLRVTITGEAGGVWLAVRERQGWTLSVDDGTTIPDAAVTMSDDTAWRLLTRGLPTDDAETRVRREGDATLTGNVLQMVSIIA